jgi:NADH-quinone oxidoreductase subunit I
MVMEGKRKFMQALTSKARQVERKPMTLWEKLYIPAIAKGMAITFKHIFRKKPTINYPEKTRPFSPVFRGVQVLNRDEEGRERCTACGLCAVACPAEAITMEAAERLPGEEHLYREEKYAVKYEINMLRCIFCGLCEEACPKDAVYLSETMVPSNYSRKTFVYGKQELLIPNPLTDPEGYAKALGKRPEKKD